MYTRVSLNSCVIALKIIKNHANSIEQYYWTELCDHEWHKVKVHKIGDRYECRKCFGLAKEEDFEPASD
jgi:hypothetical protein